MLRPRAACASCIGSRWSGPPGDEPPPTAIPFGFAFQAVTLAQGASCAKCRKEMPAGTHAHMGLTDPQPGKTKNARIFVCDACLPKG